MLQESRCNAAMCVAMLTLPPRNPRFAFTVFLKLLPQLAILPRVDKAPPGQGHAISSSNVYGGTMPMRKLGYPSQIVQYFLCAGLVWMDSRK